MPVFIRDVDVVVDQPGEVGADGAAGLGGGRVPAVDLQRTLEEIEWRRRRLAAD